MLKALRIQQPKVPSNKTNQLKHNRLNKRESLSVRYRCDRAVARRNHWPRCCRSERLPRLARTLGLWVKRLRGQVQSIQKDINRELELEDLKRQLEERGGGLKMEDIAGEDPLGLSQASNTTQAEKNERSKPE